MHSASNERLGQALSFTCIVAMAFGGLRKCTCSGVSTGAISLGNSDKSDYLPHFKESIIFNTYSPHRWDCNTQKVVP